jgi:hypothetical protein
MHFFSVRASALLAEHPETVLLAYAYRHTRATRVARHSETGHRGPFLPVLGVRVTADRAPTSNRAQAAVQIFKCRGCARMWILQLYTMMHVEEPEMFVLNWARGELQSTHDGLANRMVGGMRHQAQRCVHSGVIHAHEHTVSDTS